MPDTIPVPQNEWEALEKRAKKLAGEKSYLQLLVNMMQQLGAAAGLENVIDAMPRIVMENIGGTNLILYYFIDQDIHSVDLYGNKLQHPAIDDPEVAKVAASREMLEIEHDFSVTHMLTETGGFRGWTWVYPLLVGPDLIGVFKIENLHISTREWNRYLPTFFNYAALVLKNEILGYTRLQKAYSKLEVEMNARLEAEEALRTSNEELRLKLDSLLEPDAAIEDVELRNILNVPELHSLMEDFHKISGVATAIIDLKGEVLVGVGWQDLCTRFHRVHPQTLENCLESDLVLTRGIPEGQCKAYRCKNHLWDVSTPLFIGGRHVANIFVGQFFYEDEPPDPAVFAAQAERYGFDRDAYLEAMAQVPLCSREKIDRLMAFYSKFAALVSKLSFSNLKLAKSLLENKRIEDALRESKEGLEKTVAERTAELRKTTEELDRFFTLNLDLLCIADTDGNIRRLNLAWEKTLGYSVEELREARFFDFIHPDDLAATQDVIGKLAAQEEVSLFVNRYRCKDGGYRWIEWRAKPVGKLIYAAARDITERREYEEALTRASLEWTQAMDAFPDVIYLLDTERRLLRANQKFYSLTGTAPQEAQGRHIATLIHPHGETELCPVCQAQEAKQDVILTLETGHPSNPTGHPIEVGVHIIRDPEGRPLSILGSLHDLSRVRQYEDELRHLNESLEQRVQEEVAKNRQKDAMLIQQSRLATMGEMMHNVAHQWRQPLTTMTLILQNIQDAYEFNELSADFLNQQLDKGRQLARKMSTTIDDFRNFFCPDQQMTTFALHEPVREALNLVEASFHNNQITVLLEEDDDVQVTGYLNEFSQVLLNLLNNAKDAIKSAGVQGEVRIRVEQDDTHGVVRIRDNGGGIPEDVLPKVFDPYFTTKEGGTGIGLYMSRMIMEHMHATIELHNVPGGTEAVLRIARAQ